MNGTSDIRGGRTLALGEEYFLHPAIFRMQC